MVKEENWAIDQERVRAFFADQPGAVETEDGFLLDDCQVTLRESSGLLMGKWASPRTVIRFAGEPEAVQAVYRRFFLRFLSAGG